MPRHNLAGSYYWGESQRLTVRLSRRDLAGLDRLVELWGLDRSAAIRRALQQAAAEADRQRREALLSALPVMNVTELRSVAMRLRIKGRSRMKGEELRRAVRCIVQR